MLWFEKIKNLGIDESVIPSGLTEDAYQKLYLKINMGLTVVTPGLIIDKPWQLAILSGDESALSDKKTHELVDNLNNNALHYAAWSGNCNLLVRALNNTENDKLYSLNNEWMTFVHYAALSGDIETLCLALKKIDFKHITDTDKKTRAIVHFACISSNLKALEFAVKQFDASKIFKLTDSKGDDLLQYIVKFGNSDMWRYASSLNGFYNKFHENNRKKYNMLDEVIFSGNAKVFACVLSSYVYYNSSDNHIELKLEPSRWKMSVKSVIDAIITAKCSVTLPKGINIDSDSQKALNTIIATRERKLHAQRLETILSRVLSGEINVFNKIPQRRLSNFELQPRNEYNEAQYTDSRGNTIFDYAAWSSDVEIFKLALLREPTKLNLNSTMFDDPDQLMIKTLIDALKTNTSLISVTLPSNIDQTHASEITKALTINRQLISLNDKIEQLDDAPKQWFATSNSKHWAAKKATALKSLRDMIKNQDIAFTPITFNQWYRENHLVINYERKWTYFLSKNHQTATRVLVTALCKTFEFSEAEVTNLTSLEPAPSIVIPSATVVTTPLETSSEALVPETPTATPVGDDNLPSTSYKNLAGLLGIDYKARKKPSVDNLLGSFDDVDVNPVIQHDDTKTEELLSQLPNVPSESIPKPNQTSYARDCLLMS